MLCDAFAFNIEWELLTTTVAIAKRERIAASKNKIFLKHCQYQAAKFLLFVCMIFCLTVSFLIYNILLLSWVIWFICAYYYMWTSQHSQYNVLPNYISFIDVSMHLWLNV